MKKLIPILSLIALCGLTAYAADVTGYIVDKNCASKKAMWTNSDCAASCAAKGALLVLVKEDDGKVYTISKDDQDKVKAHGGHKVTVTGNVDGDTIKVDSVKM